METPGNGHAGEVTPPCATPAPAAAHIPSTPSLVKPGTHISQGGGFPPLLLEAVLSSPALPGWGSRWGGAAILHRSSGA